MFSSMRGLVLAAALSIVASAASAVVIVPTFSDPLSAGDSTQSNAIATANESFGATVLGFSVTEDLLMDVSITVNPFNVSPNGTPSNTISISYAIGGGPDILIPILQSGATGNAGLNDILVLASQSVMFTVSGNAGAGGNTVSFNVETEALPPVPVLPAGALMMTGLAALGLSRRRKG